MNRLYKIDEVIEGTGEPGIDGKTPRQLVMGGLATAYVKVTGKSWDGKLEFDYLLINSRWDFVINVARGTCVSLTNRLYAPWLLKAGGQTWLDWRELKLLARPLTETTDPMLLALVSEFGRLEAEGDMEAYNFLKWRWREAWGERAYCLNQLCEAASCYAYKGSRWDAAYRVQQALLTVANARSEDIERIALKGSAAT